MNYNGQLQQPGADITLEAGGSHQFNLGHLRREGALRLVRLLLREAGYNKPATWRVRVEKKFGCGPETRPMTIVGAKRWCCYLKIKPGDNNTAHFCSLLMPDGYQGEVVYESLKDAQEKVNFAWLHGLEGEGMSGDADEPGTAQGTEVYSSDPQTAARAAAQRLLGSAEAGVPPQVVDLPGDNQTAAGVAAELDDREITSAENGESDETAVLSRNSPLFRWTRDEDKVRLTLLAIHEVEMEGQAASHGEFYAALSCRLGWQGLGRHQTGAIFRTLGRHGHIQKIRRGSRACGYGLTLEGRQFIKDMLPANAAGVPPAAAAPASGSLAAAPLPPGAAQFMNRLTDVTQKYVTAYQQLQENRATCARLRAEVERLDAEAAQLCQIVNDPEVQALLERLIQLTVGGSGITPGRPPA